MHKQSYPFGSIHSLIARLEKDCFFAWQPLGLHFSHFAYSAWSVELPLPGDRHSSRLQAPAVEVHSFWLRQGLLAFLSTAVYCGGITTSYLLYIILLSLFPHQTHLNRDNSVFKICGVR